MNSISRPKNSVFSRETLPYWLLGAGIGLRLLYLWMYAAGPLFHVAAGPDIAEYHARALEIFGGRFFSAEAEPHGVLYPWLLAGIYRLTGVSVAAARAVGSAMTLLAYWMLFRSVEQRGPRRVALIFLGVAMLYPAVIFHGAELISEPLLLLLLAVAVRLIDFRRFAGAGGVAGLGACAHPAALGFLAAFGIHFLWRRRWGRLWRFSAAAAIPVLAVSIFQSLRAERPVLLQTNSAFNLWLGNRSGATGGCDLRPGLAWETEHWSARVEAVRRGVTVDRVYWGRVGAFWRDQPLEALGLTGRKILLLGYPRELAAGADVPELMESSVLLRGLGVVLFPLWMFAFAGLVLVCRSRRLRRRYWPFWLWGLGMAGLQILTVCAGRYRFGWLPAVFLLMALACARLSWRTLGILACAGLALGGLIRIPQPAGEGAALRGEAYYRLGKLDLAERELASAAGKIDDPARFDNLLGAIAQARGDFAQAETRYLAAHRGDTFDATAAMNLALLAVARRNAAQAEHWFAEMKKRNAEHPLGTYNYALFRQSVGDAAGAEREFRNYIKLAPGDYRGFNALGVLAFSRGDRTEAARWFEQALRRAPGHEGIRRNLKACGVEKK